MTRPGEPLLLAEPSRFTAWSRGMARVGLATLGLALLASFEALGAIGGEPGDPTLVGAAAEAMRGGIGYYEAAVGPVRGGGATPCAWNVPMPLTALIGARLPEGALATLLYALASVAFLVWWSRLRTAIGGRYGPVLIGLPLAIGLAPFFQPSLGHVVQSMAEPDPYAPASRLYSPELWAGLLVVLSLGFRSRARWVEAAALGLTAAVAHVGAAVYVAVMAMMAFRSGARREAAGWLLASALTGGAFWTHGLAVARVAGPADASAWDRIGLTGPGGFVRDAAEAGALGLAPLAVAAPLATLALFGWTAWRSEQASRVAATLGAYALLFCLVPDLDPTLALIPAALLPVGLAFAPDGLRDLVRAAAGRRRRITVTRVAR